MILGGSKLDSPTPSHEIYTSTLGLIFAGPEGPVMVTSGHAVGSVGSPIVLADGLTLGHVTHNAYLQGPVGAAGPLPPHPRPSPHGVSTSVTPSSGGRGSGGGGALSPAFSPAGPDVASGRWQGKGLGLPLSVLFSVGAVSVPLPVTGGEAPTPGVPIKVFGAAGGLRLGVVEEATATVTDARSREQIHGVAVGRYPSTSADSGAPIVSLSLETHLPVIVGFHGGTVYEPGPAVPSGSGGLVSGAKSWFVPWPSAQSALGLPPFP